MTASNVWVAYMDCPAAYAYILLSHMYSVCVCVCTDYREADCGSHEAPSQEYP